MGADRSVEEAQPADSELLSPAGAFRRLAHDTELR